MANEILKQEYEIGMVGLGVMGRNLLLPGGLINAYERVKPVLEAVAARVNGAPCVTYLGPSSAGHFVKMVHNGIEYGLMQLISETYALMKLALNYSDEELKTVFSEWNNGELNGFLMEITSNIFGKVDDKTGKRLIDEILDVARQKGTGMWTSQSAMELQVPVPTIDIAVAMRDLSVFEEQREMADKIYRRPDINFTGNPENFVTQLRKAFYVSMITAYAQGFALLSIASDKYGYHLDLESVARIWRGGCIIRAAILEDIQDAYHNKHDGAHTYERTDAKGTYHTEWLKGL